MADQPAGEDDWVKQMLAEAMLGRSPLPPVAPDPVDADPEPDEPDEPGQMRYQVVLDVPVASTAELESFQVQPEPEPVEPAAVEPAAVEPEVRYQVVLDEPEESTVEAEPTVELLPESEPEPALEPGPETVVETEDNDKPAPATASRLFDRPNFDATNDPGVDEMLEAERSGPLSDPAVDRSHVRGVVEWLVVLGSAVVVALLLRAFLFQAFFIPSESMEETLRVDDRVLVNKLSYRIGDVSRGEVVVFRRPDDQPGEFRDLIKRVIGLPGESIEARDNTIFIDGQVLIEPYLTPGEVIGDFGPVVIPDGEYFVMGDNRDNSGDSRVFGTVDEDRFIGRAFFLFWPLDRIGSL